MEKYIALLFPNQLKEEFIEEFIAVLSNISKEQIVFRKRFESNLFEIMKHPTINLSLVQIALVDKVTNMMDKGAGFLDVITMLNSFSRGTKRLKTNITCDSRHDEQYQYTDKDGNEKLSHKGNIPNAHFRWNFGERYTLSIEDLEKIKVFVQPLIKYI